MKRPSLRSWAGQAMVAAVAVGVVVAAPLAARNQAPPDGVTISGARSLSDQVSVSYRAADSQPTTDVNLLAFNDLHGNLEAASLNIYGKFAGGAAYLAKAVKDRQARYGDQQATIFAGDNIGASPLANGLFFEEPVTIASNLMHVDFASVGNHEFDKGKDELLRIQNGGCRPVGGCTAAPYRLVNGTTTNVYPGADFQYLSANVVVDATGKTLFPAFGTKTFTTDDGARNLKVGFIGEVLEATPTIVTPTGVAGLTFQDEAAAANRAVRQLRQAGVQTSVLVIHEGGFQDGTSVLNGCQGNLAGSPIADIASRLDPGIKVIISAHTHAEYRCTVTTKGITRLITSASSFGRILSDITLTLDTTGRLVRSSADNVIVENALNAPGPGVSRVADPSREDPEVQAVVNQYVTASAPLANQVIGSIQGDLTRTGSPGGESTLGDVIADAQLAATQPDNQISSGGEAPGQVTYGEAFTVQPFGNSLVTKTMTGDMLRRLLQQQFPNCGGQTTKRILQISSTFRYEQDPSAATCEGRIGRMFVNGTEVGPADSFRVTMNNFLATGGDGFTVFKEGTNDLGGAQDIDALVAAFTAAGSAGIAVPPLDRIVPPAA